MVLVWPSASRLYLEDNLSRMFLSIKLYSKSQSSFQLDDFALRLIFIERQAIMVNSLRQFPFIFV
jgi:hypothetical protein